MTAAPIAAAAVPDGLRSLTTDPRTVAAADLLAERHQPSALSTADLRGLVSKYERRLRGLVDLIGENPSPRDRIQRLQALQDAIRYRRARAAEECAGCEPGRPCDDHGRDLDLISEYQQAARKLGAT